MKILGIDHGKHSGWALIENDKYFACGSFIVNDGTLGERLESFKNRIEELILLYKPDVIAVEKPVHKRGGDVTLKLTALYGMIHYAAFLHDTEVVEVIPTSMKLAITKSGKAEKDMVATYLSDLYKIPVSTITDLDYYVLNVYKDRKIIKHKGELKEVHYDKSDALGLATYAYKKKEGLLDAKNK